MYDGWIDNYRSKFLVWFLEFMFIMFKWFLINVEIVVIFGKMDKK